MRDFGSKRPSTSGLDHKAAAAGLAPGKRTLTEMLPASPPVQRKIEAPVMPAGAPTIDELFGGAPSIAVDEPPRPVQRNARGIPFLQLGGATTDLPTVAHEAAPTGPEAAAHTGGAPLPAGARTMFEPRFGQDFGDVRVHTGDVADAATREIDARAYAIGDDIVFGSGQYQPDQRAGQHLLAHELVHVVQQRGGSRAVQRTGDPDPIPPADATARLGHVIAELEALHTAVAPDEPSIEVFAGGIAKLRSAQTRGTAASHARILALFAEQLPPGRIAGVPPRQTSGTAAPAATPPIGEHRPPSVAAASLSMSQRGDPAEEEAERVADAVMSGSLVSVMAAPSGIYRGGPGYAQLLDDEDLFTAIAVFIQAVVARFWPDSSGTDDNAAPTQNPNNKSRTQKRRKKRKRGKKNDKKKGNGNENNGEKEKENENDGEENDGEENDGKKEEENEDDGEENDGEKEKENDGKKENDGEKEKENDGWTTVTKSQRPKKSDEEKRQNAEERRNQQLVQARRAVDNVLASYKSNIAKLLPGAALKYRGSLATGWKGARKVKHGVARRFDPGDFDCDAFIEVPNKMWATWRSSRSIDSSAAYVELRDFAGEKAAELKGIEKSIAKGLAEVKGYRTHRFGAKVLGDFHLRLQPVSHSIAQKLAGNVYPVGSLKQAEQDEDSLPIGTARVDNEMVTGPTMPEEHHEVEVRRT